MFVGPERGKSLDLTQLDIFGVRLRSKPILSVDL